MMSSMMRFHVGDTATAALYATCAAYFFRQSSTDLVHVACRIPGIPTDIGLTASRFARELSTSSQGTIWQGVAEGSALIRGRHRGLHGLPHDAAAITSVSTALAILERSMSLTTEVGAAPKARVT
jgi:hypothetical protein